MTALLQLVHMGFLVAFVAVPILVFRRAVRQVRAGRSGRIKAFLLGSLIALSPTVGYAVYFFALVGIEELSGKALIPEETARSFLIVVGLGLVVWLLGLIPFAALLTRTRPSSDLPIPPSGK